MNLHREAPRVAHWEIAVLRSRVLSAIILLPLVLAVLHLGGIPWLAAVLLIGVLGWREMTQLLQGDHFAVDRLLGLCFIVAAIAEAYLRGTGLVQADLLRPLLAGLIVISLGGALFDRSPQPTTNWAVNVASALYLGFLLGHFVTLRLRPDGENWVILVLALTWANDTLAYFVGTALGRHKFWPRLSPKKTWEGVAGGATCALVVGGLLTPHLVGVSPWLGMLLGLVSAAAATFGDLAISLLKRMAHIKDSGNLIPGHGGMLDRLDSLMFTFPITVYFALLVTTTQNVTT